MLDSRINLEDFLVRRSAALRKAIERLAEEMQEARAELDDLSLAAKTIGIKLDGDEASQSDGRYAKKAGASDKTIKEYVVEILTEATGGLTANQLLEIMADRYGAHFVRSSLSPQLSRLKAGGVLSRDQGCWVLAQKPTNE